MIIVQVERLDAVNVLKLNTCCSVSFGMCMKNDIFIVLEMRVKILDALSIISLHILYEILVDSVNEIIVIILVSEAVFSTKQYLYAEFFSVLQTLVISLKKAVQLYIVIINKEMVCKNKAVKSESCIAFNKLIRLNRRTRACRL